MRENIFPSSITKIVHLSMYYLEINVKISHQNHPTSICSRLGTIRKKIRTWKSRKKDWRREERSRDKEKVISCGKSDKDAKDVLEI